MSSTTWTTPAVASSAVAARCEVWRAVGAQHVASTLARVDSLEEQHLLERLLDESKPPVPSAADLRAGPLVRDHEAWTRPDDYAACHGLARMARTAGVGAIRYESVRDPRRGGCCAVLTPGAFVPPVPFGLQTWLLSVSRDRAVWQRTDALCAEEHEFVAAAWAAGAPASPAPPRRPRPRRPRP